MKSYSNEYIILLLILILSGFGIVVMYSASSIYAMNKYNNYMFFLSHQIKWVLMGFIFMIGVSKVNYHILKKITYGLLILSWIVLILGYFFKGPNPAARWLIIGGRSWMTTSDFARISLIIFTAFFIEKNNKYLNNWKFITIYYAPFLFVTLLLILFQPDTSTTITITIIILVMLFVASVSWKFILSMIIVGITSLTIKIIYTPYAFNRIINWNDEQKVQALNALGTGGLLGSGLGDSIVKNGYLPEAHTDFILPIIGEELGFLGIIILFILFLLLYRVSISVVQKAPDRFSMFLSIGIITSTMVYFLINSAYVVGFAPTTGLPMPFISYGGSHTIFTLISMGILTNIAKKGKFNRNSYYKGFSYEL